MQEYRAIRACLVKAIAALLILLASVAAQETDASTDEGTYINWMGGPDTVTVGQDLATLVLDETYLFAGEADTRMLMQAIGNIPTGNEVCAIVPRSDDEDWYIVIEYEEVGYIRDDDKDDIDADDILESYQQGTEEANAQRVEFGMQPLHVTGWYETPRYDDRTNNLVWALTGYEEGSSEFVNYNTRLLGREGFMSVILVAGPDVLDGLKPRVENLLANLTYNQGKRYLDFVEGDRVAEYGLVALVAGATGVAAAKMGLFAMLGKWLAKMWKVLVAVALAAGAGIRRFFRGKRADNGA